MSGSSQAAPDGQLQFVSAAQDDPLAQPLLAELAVEYAQRYGGTPSAHLSWLPVPAAELAPPDGGLLIGVLHGVPVTGGAFRRFDADTAELKRIWTDRAHRRRGYARALLAALEAETAARGYRRLYLITGNRQPEAEALYDATGYTRVAAEPLPSWGPFHPIAFEKVTRMTGQLHLGVALDGYGWHPQAWRATLASDPGTPSVLSGRYWADVAATAERGLLDFLTIDDTLMPQPGRRERIDPRRLAGRADAVLVAARIAPATQHIGLIPVATVTHTEPLHVSKSISTLDYVSHGRAGWQARVSVTTHEAALFGRRDGSQIPLFDEAVEYVDVVRRLWDSWEDDAVIRDVTTGRYVDGGKLHYIDFTGKYFSVKGPSITPRPPQGQPVVAALAHAGPVYEFAAASADVVFITPTDDASLRCILDEVHAAGGTGLKVFADVVAAFDGRDVLGDFSSDALVFAGSATELADMLLEWQRIGVDGARLRPAVNATDLLVIVDEVVPLLQRAGRFRTGYVDGETLRARLHLPVAPNRYAPVNR